MGSLISHQASVKKSEMLWKRGCKRIRDGEGISNVSWAHVAGMLAA